MKKPLFIIFIIVFGFSLYGQNNSDYLLDSISTSQNSNSLNTSKAYIKGISTVFKTDFPEDKEKFQNFIENSIDFAHAEGFKREEALSFYYLGKYHIAGHSNYSKAIPALLEGLAIFEEISDSSGISRCYMQLGLIGYITQYFEDGIKNFELSLKYSEYPTSIYLMAITYTEMEDYPKAKQNFLKAIDLYTLEKNTSGLIECYMYLGKLYQEAGQLDSALFYFKKAIEDQTIFDKEGVSKRPYALISSYYLQVDQLDTAKYLAHISLEKTQNTHDQLSAIISAETLSKVYEIEKNYEKAHFYLHLHHELKYENVQGSTKQKIAEMQSMFDFKKRMANEKLIHKEEMRKKNRIKNILLISAVFIFLISGALWSRLQYIRKSRAELQHEKNISENLLLNILPAEVAEELKEKGESGAKDFENTTVLFSDFIEFTEAAQTLTAQELVAEINVCFKAFDNIMQNYKIEKIKTIGDAYMAAGGLHTPRTTEPKDVVMAGIEMQDFMLSRKKDRNSKGLPYFEMRVGIHTGPVVAGIVGVKKFQYDIWGDTVNTASRMESNSQMGKVNISHTTYDLIKGYPEFDFEKRGKIAVKGKKPMEMWFVTSPSIE